MVGETKPCSSYEVIREGEDTILKVDCDACPYAPSVEDSSICMAKTIERLMEIGIVTKIVFTQKRDYEYDYNQTQLLREIAALIARFTREKEVFGYKPMGVDTVSMSYYNALYAQVQRLVFHLMKSDPLGAYVELQRLMRRERTRMEHISDQRLIPSEKRFLSLVNYVLEELEKTRLVKIAKPYIPGYRLGDRSVYRRIFSPSIKPDFMFTKLMATYPVNGEELDTYSVGETEITIFGFPESARYLYHLLPPEFRLSEEKYEIVDLARKIMAEHKPTRQEFVDPERIREVFYNVGRDLIEELVTYRGYKFRAAEMDELARILVRYTIGFGLIEVLLSDERIQDVSINSPMGQIPMFVVQQDFGDCYTNIVPTRTEAESWASKLRLISGRPLDEANQILDTELRIPGATARVSTITEPLAATGLAFSFRRHRDKPWTLPLFMHVKMLNGLAAGLLSFLVDGTRTMLVAGTRSSGKTSLLGSLLVEIMRRYRILTIEDTLELPAIALRKMGFNIQQMKVATALAKGASEMSATDGIRSTLRLGDSALFVGEVRSDEAIALYEAMRVGAAANVVAGTLHADSPYGVYDRVVNDIGVPRTSFKATDVLIVANPIKTPGGLKRIRRVTQITEVRKHWEQDPVAEGGFSDLFKYDVTTDQLVPSEDLLNGDSDIIKAVAGNIKGLAGNWDAVWDNIQLRAKVKETLVDYANKVNNLDMLEAEFVIKSNDVFHKAVEMVQEEVGAIDSKQVFFEWEQWLKRELKRQKEKQ
ncbi:type II/IV secretion system ATPase subunit [Candidatus Woesearchaeota archaeon]|nr:type II/IV secretion system ATPase subunit [Candidatus Woesearchaeota archaeon]